MLNYTKGQFDISSVVFGLSQTFWTFKGDRKKMTQANGFKICLAAGMFGRIILTLTLSEPFFQQSVFLWYQTFLYKLFIRHMHLKNMLWLCILYFVMFEVFKPLYWDIMNIFKTHFVLGYITFPWSNILVCDSLELSPYSLHYYMINFGLFYLGYNICLIRFSLWIKLPMILWNI